MAARLAYAQRTQTPLLELLGQRADLHAGGSWEMGK